MASGNRLVQLLQTAVQNHVSDIHMRVGQMPGFRTKDGVVDSNTAAVSEQEMTDFCRAIIKDEDRKTNINELQDFDGSFDIANLARFRYNVFRNQGKLGVVLRVIPNNVPSIKDLGLPATLETIAELPRGLVLVTGATGSGKSSTLAAMINHINETQRCHIVTIEDPVEFVHPIKKSRVTQREVGRDTKNFATALKSALRQDPDVILVGEMRDIETLDIALKAAETGHLVFTTVHTTDAIKTIGRLVALYPPEEQRMARLRLAENLEASVSQRLISTKDGNGRVVAMEIMRSNLAIRECIANAERTSQMNDFIDKAHEVLGSQTFDLHLAKLVRDGIISEEVALESASNSADFQRNMSFGENASSAPDPSAEAGPPEEKLSLETFGETMQENLDVASQAAKAMPATASAPAIPLAPPTPMMPSGPDTMPSVSKILKMPSPPIPGKKVA